MEGVFIVSVLVLVFVYAGYGPVLYLLRVFRGKKELPVPADETLPDVAVVIAAYNEAAVIGAKLRNTLELDYPKDKLMVYVVSDGSTDQTNAIVSEFGQVTLLYETRRAGKTAALNHAMRHVTQPVTVFTDANVMLNPGALRQLVRHYADPRVGGVSGEKQVLSLTGAGSAAEEGLYWRYESFVKREEAAWFSLIGAAGELFSLRTALFRSLPEDTLLDDFRLSLLVLEQGRVVAYEPGARAIEPPSLNMGEEYKRKVRIAAGGLQAVLRIPLWRLPWRALVSCVVHRYARWTVTPVLLPLAWVSNLLVAGQSSFYVAACCAQTLFHLAALAGWRNERRGKRTKLLALPYYFDFMHLCVWAGWFRYLSGRQAFAWEKALRFSEQNH